MKKINFMMVAVCVVLFMGTTAQAAEQELYTVVEGDTLWEISTKYGISVDDVILANPQFRDPDMIYPSEIVYIPMDGNAFGVVGASIADKGDGSTDTLKARPNSKSHIVSIASANELELQVFNLVNKEREKNGLYPISLSAEVSNVARVKSEDMRDGKYFAHQSPTYGSPFEMLREFGMSYRMAGENIAKGQKTAEDVMKAWMNSEGHRANILHKKYSEIGVGCVTDSSGTTYWTQQFITR